MKTPIIPIQAGAAQLRKIQYIVATTLRELAGQTGEQARIIVNRSGGRVSCVCVQVDIALKHVQLAAGVDILIATPGRLLDLIENHHLDVSHVRYLVMDEGDVLSLQHLASAMDNIITDIFTQSVERSAISGLMILSASLPPAVQDALMLKFSIKARIWCLPSSSESRRTHVEIQRQGSHFGWESETASSNDWLCYSCAGQTNDRFRLYSWVSTFPTTPASCTTCSLSSEAASCCDRRNHS